MLFLWVVLGQDRAPGPSLEGLLPPIATLTSTPAPVDVTPTIFPVEDSYDEWEAQPEEEAPTLITGIPFFSPTKTVTKPVLGIILPSPTPYPVVEALQEIQKLTEDAPPALIRRGGAPPEESSARKSTSDSDQNDKTGAKSRLGRVSGQPRGFVMLYLMHPKARANIERQVQILLDSQLDNLYLSVLIDGTFSFDEAYLNSVLQRLNTDNRTVALQLYLVSGPTMRRWETTPIETLFSKIHPEDFRYFIQEDDFTRNDFKSIAKKANPFFDLNRELNQINTNYVTVMLEDNLDTLSYKAMRSLAREVIGDRAVFIRNPCPGCFNGNDTESLGDPIEYHELKDFEKLRVSDAYTMDGVGYRYADEPGTSGITIEETKNLISRSFAEEHRYFGLWRADRQGLGSGATQLDHPDNRNYVVPTEEQARVDIEILREGLELVTNITPTVP